MAFPVAAAMIAGSSLGGAGMGLMGQQEANSAQRQMFDAGTQQNILSAREQMAFQQYMSNTAYSRARDDMVRAGLNPMLAFMQGGASTPSGAAGSAAGAPQVGNVAEEIPGAIASATNSVLAKENLENQVNKTASEIALNKTSEATQEAMKRKADADAAVSNQSAKKLATEMKAVKAEADMRELVAIPAAAGRALSTFKGVGNAAKSFAEAVGTKELKKSAYNKAVEKYLQKKGLSTWSKGTGEIHHKPTLETLGGKYSGK